MIRNLNYFRDRRNWCIYYVLIYMFVFVVICFFVVSDFYFILKFYYLLVKNICMFILCFVNSFVYGKSLVEFYW